jgi:hypothetical protein
LVCAIKVELASELASINQTVTEKREAQ